MRNSLSRGLGAIAATVLLFVGAPVAVAEETAQHEVTGEATVQVPAGEKPHTTVGIPAEADLKKAGEDNPFRGFDADTKELRVDKKWAKKNDVEKGMIVVVGRSRTLPDGLMVWVEDVNKDGDTAVIKTRPARLNEALAGTDAKQYQGQTLKADGLGVVGTVANEEIAQSIQQRNKDVEIAGSSDRGGVEIYAPYSVDFSFEFKRKITKNSCTDGTFDYKGASKESKPTACEFEGPGSLEADFELAFDAQAALTLDTEGLLIKEFSVKGDSGMQGHTKVAANNEIWGRLEWQMADLTFPFSIPAGPVAIPVNVTVKPTIFLEIDASGNATATIGNIDMGYEEVGLEYSSRDGFKYLQGTPKFTSDDPKLDGSAVLRTAVGVDPNVGVNIASFLGVDTSVGAQAATAFLAEEENPVCTMEIGMQGKIGISQISLSKIPVIGWFFGGIEKPLNKFIREHATYEWAYPNLYSTPNLCGTKPISVGDKVWIDANKNGLYDEGEKPMVGAEVLLLRGVDPSIADDPNSDAYKDALVASTKTNDKGEYFFDKDPSHEDGKLMPAHYTIVVKPVAPTGDESYPYADIAPHGFEATKRYVSEKPLNHTLADLQRDSGGKYAWNTDNYSALMDGTRFQDRGAATPTLVDSTMSSRERHEARLGGIKAYQKELAETKGKNDVVDFGFVPAPAPLFRTARVTGKVYVATTAISDMPTGAQVGNLHQLIDGEAVPGAEVTLIPLKLETAAGRLEPAQDAEPIKITTDISGRYSKTLPSGTYRAEVTSVPEGFKLAEGAENAKEIQVSADTNAKALVPDKNWVNFGVGEQSIAVPVQVTAGDAGIEDVGVSVRHMATPIATGVTNAEGVAQLQLKDSKGLVPWTLSVTAPDGKAFAPDAANALGEGSCSLERGETTLNCPIRVREGQLYSDKHPETPVEGTIRFVVK